MERYGKHSLCSNIHLVIYSCYVCGLPLNAYLPFSYLLYLPITVTDTMLDTLSALQI